MDDDISAIILLFGLGYLLYKGKGITESITTTITELKTGTSKLYSPYTMRYFREGAYSTYTKSMPKFYQFEQERLI